MTVTDNDQQSSFDRFMLAEYEHIARAHFATIETISTFFKHYILIISLPIPIAAIFLKSSEWPLLAYVRAYPYVVPVCIWALVLAGIAVLCYIINLRHDALLYARTVNGIRKYFYDRSALGVSEEMRIRVLPRTIYKPRYLEWSYFLFVVLAVTIIHTVYAAAGSLMWVKLANLIGWSAIGMWGIPVFMTGLHLLAYWSLSWHRERKYLRSCIVGVDIDGVLTRHREHFCRFLKEHCGKELDPKRITRIPVHECKGLGVTRSDEAIVFNRPEYWMDMPARSDAARVLKQLKNILGYRIFLFSHRPWPDFGEIPEDKKANLKRLWTGENLKSITHEWLKKHEITYDRLIIEKGNVYTHDRATRTRNRFIVSQDRQVRVFVEDDFEKAMRLSAICDLVFLIAHPYNEVQDSDLPHNLIRVDTWHEIWEYARRVM